MQSSELHLLAESLILSASGVLQQLQGLVDLFTAFSSTPAELCHLRDAVLALRELFETFCGADISSLRTVKQRRAAQGLRGELLLAGKLFDQLKQVIQVLHRGQHIGPRESQIGDDGLIGVKELPSSALKARWSSHRTQLGKLHKDLRDNCSRCLGEMLLMNVSVSADVEPRLELSSDSDGPLSTWLPNERDGDEQKMLLEERLENVEGLSSVDASKFLVLQQEPKMLRQDVEPKAPPKAPRTSFRRQVTDNSGDVDDVELMLSGIAASVTSSSSMSERTLASIAASVASSSSINEHMPRYRPRRVVGPREPVNNERFCTCSCHNSGKSPSIWAISAFKSALGVMSLDFREQSDVACSDCSSTCRTGRRGRSMRLLYSFPTWLFHAAISASFTDTTGSPEFVLRVLRRIPTDAKSIFSSVFGTIARGDVDALKRALRTRQISVFDINGINGTGVLWTCVAMNRFDLLEILLFEGADLFQLDDKGTAPYSFLLHTLFTSPRIDNATRTRLEALLPMEQMLEACQLNELHKIAVGLRHTSVREYLRLVPESKEANSYDIRFRTPLGFAAARGDLLAVRELLEAGALPDLEIPTQAKPKGPLASACNNGHLAVVEELLAAGADVNALNSSQHSLHHLAPAPNSASIAACLIQHGADVNVQDKFHSTPLDLASHHDNAVLADYLLRHGADPNHRDWEGSNALQIAISADACATATVLLEHNVDYRNVDIYNRGILHYLANFGSQSMMEIMARHRMVDLDVNAPDNQNQTPTQLCRARSDSTEALQETFGLLLASITRDSSQRTHTAQ